MRSKQATYRLLVISLLLGGLTSLAAQAQEEPAANPGRPRTPQGGRVFDTNGDGTIDQAERQAARERLGNRPAGNRPGAPPRPANGANSGETNRGSDSPANGRGQAPGALLGAQERAALMRRYDADGDGQLSQEERQDAMQAMGMNGNFDREAIMRRFDANEDGQLDANERTQIQEEMRNRMQNGAGGAAFGAGPAPSGNASIREIVDTTSLRESFDADGDGELSAAERAAARAAIEKKRRN